MVRAIARLALSGDETADVVQEAFLRALGQLKTLRRADAFGPWLATIARNVVRDVERQRWGLSPSADEPSRPGTQHEEMEARAARRAVQSLPKAYRETVVMRLVQGMTGREIAARTGLSVGSVRVNLHRGIRLLRQRLEAVSKKAG
jgi:RNA polymerase sigma-70 factor (ECF subfamily)